MRRAVFLDRDGVLNRAFLRDGRPCPPSGLHEFEILPGVQAACRAFKKAGLILIVVTNQPDVASGTQRKETVEEMNGMLRSHLPVDDIRVCYHDAADGCVCRKPLPGMLVDAAGDWEVDLSGSFMVGDRWKDVEAGRRAGCKTVFIDHGYPEQRPPRSDKVARNLSDAAQWILSVIPLEKERTR